MRDVQEIIFETDHGIELYARHVPWDLVEVIVGGKYDGSPQDEDRLREFLIENGQPDWVRRADHVFDSSGITLLGPRVNPPTSEIEVYHPAEEAPHGTRFHEHPEAWRERREHYEKVAEGSCQPNAFENLGAILEAVWTEEQNGVEEHPGPLTMEPAPRRSLSVGDVVLIDGTPFEVGSVGFRIIADRNEDGTMERDPIEIPEPEAAANR